LGKVRFYYKDACDLVKEIAEGLWIPDLVTFQYFFSDMKKHSQTEKIDEFHSGFF